MRGALLIVAIVAAMLASPSALACAVCGTGKQPNDWAFGLTTALLSFLPLMIFGGIVFFIVRAHRKARREEAASISTPD